MELDELYWFLEYKPRTETREKVYLITMVSRKPRQIVGHVVSRNRSARTIQRMVDKAEEAAIYCTDGYSGYLDVVFPGKHLFNIHSKRDTFTVEGVNADLLMILTSVEKVCINLGQETEEKLGKITVEQAKKYMDEGHFGVYNMLPKFQAAIEFIQEGEGRQVLITSFDKVKEGLKGKTGTIIE